MTLGESGAACRPTAVPDGVTCPPLPHSASAGPLRTEPCQCGDDITAPRDDPAPWVWQHNQTPHHMAWRLRNRL